MRREASCHRHGEQQDDQSSRLWAADRNFRNDRKRDHNRNIDDNCIRELR